MGCDVKLAKIGVGLFAWFWWLPRALTTFSGVASSLEKDSTRLADGLGDEVEELLLLFEGKGEKLPGALAGPRPGCIFGGASKWVLV